MVKFQSVSKSFEKKQILTDFSYQFKNTGLYAVTGASGIGKTTFLRLIAHLEKPDKGYIKSPTMVAYSFQEYRLFSNLTVFDNIKLVSFQHANADNCALIDEYLSRLLLLDEKNKYPHELSGGMKQRVSLIRAFVSTADVILLDEPTKELDENLSDLVVKIIQELSRTKLVIVSLHSSDFAQKIGAEVISL